MQMLARSERDPYLACLHPNRIVGLKKELDDSQSLVYKSVGKVAFLQS